MPDAVPIATHGHPRPAAAREAGTALILGLFFAVLSAGIVVTGTLIQRANRQKTKTAFQLNSQALQFARAGMTESVNWFRRQNNQPVVEFAPQLDQSASPPVLDTEDPEIGLVREFGIEGKTWGRYEVWRAWENDPDPVRRAWREQVGAEDVGDERGSGIDGGAWRMVSVGYVYQREDDQVPFDQAPNRVIAQRMLEAEILRRRLQPPGQAALTVGDGNDAHVNTYGRIAGGQKGAGIYYPAGSGKPTVGSKKQQRVTGDPAMSQGDNIDMSVEGVFGVSYEELRATADSFITNPDDFPDPVPDYNVIVAEVSSIKFDDQRPLRGFGVVFIRGNVTIAAGSNSHFRGLLYVDGSLTVRAPSLLEGAVVVRGNFNIQGSGDYALIRFDDDILDALRKELSQYRFVGAYHQLHSGQ